MFLPLGDNVNKRTLPVAGLALLMISCAVYAHEYYLYGEDYTKGTSHIRSFFMTFGLRMPELREGRLWGLITHMFVHADFFHILGNMLVFWAMVGTLEAATGSLQFIGWYLVWGLAAGVTQLLVDLGDNRPLVGASGAIAGVIGAYFVAFGALTKIKAIFFLGFIPIRGDLPAGLYVGIWLAGQFGGLAEAARQGTNVAFFAHLGGFAAGALTGILLLRQLKAKISRDDYGQLQTAHEELEDTGLSPAAQAILLREKMAAAEAAKRATQEMSFCPHCAGPITAKNKIADKMFRCPHDGCKRLIYG